LENLRKFLSDFRVGVAHHYRNIRKTIEFEEGSGNVFADLGLTDADELYARAQIGFGVYRILKQKGLKAA
jgi:hypothetical protein